jgi:hypothetical protein
MNDKVICEVLLYGYKELERRCEVIDIQVLRIALASRNNDVYESAERIFKLTDEKICYCNAKVIIDEAVKKMKKCDELKAFHIQGLQSKEIAEQEGILVATVLKRLQRQRDKLYQIIIDSNQSKDLQAIINTSRWLTSRYNTIINAQNQAVDGKKDKGKEILTERNKKAYKGK